MRSLKRYATGTDPGRHKAFSLLLAAVLTIGLALPARAEDTSGTTAEADFTASEPDATGVFTVDLTIKSAMFNAFQFALWYDADTVTPVKADGTAAGEFSDFAKKTDTGWMSTVGTELDSEKGLIDFTGYVTPGQSTASDGLAKQKGVAVAGESGVLAFTFRFKQTGGTAPVIKLATADGGTPSRDYLPEGGMVLNAGAAAPLRVTIDLPGADTVTIDLPGDPPKASLTKPGAATQPSTTETPEQKPTQTPEQKPEPKPADPANPTADELLQSAVLLPLGSNAAVAGGGVVAIYPGEPDVTAYIRNDRTFVPVRFVAERLGAAVDWDGATKTVTITGNGRTVRMTLGSLTYTIDGMEKTMDAPAETVPSAQGYVRTTVPIRFVAEALGRQVEWDARRALVVIGGAAEWNMESEAASAALDKAQSMLALYGMFVK